MPLITTTVDVDVEVDMDDFSDYDLLEEVEARGLKDEFGLDDYDDDELVYELEKRKSRLGISSVVEEAILCWQRGNIQEALVQIEQAYPELYGITRLRKE